MEWNVPIYSSFILMLILYFKSSFEKRVIISFAAFSVKVTIIMFSGFRPFFAIKYIALLIKVKVLPVPGPAIISWGPSVYLIASICFLLAVPKSKCIFHYQIGCSETLEIKATTPKQIPIYFIVIKISDYLNKNKENKRVNNQSIRSCNILICHQNIQVFENFRPAYFGGRAHRYSDTMY